MNKGLTIGIIIAIAVGAGVAVATSYYEPNDSSEKISPEGSSEPNKFTITLSEEVGFQEPP